MAKKTQFTMKSLGPSAGPATTSGGGKKRNALINPPPSNPPKVTRKASKAVPSATVTTTTKVLPATTTVVKKTRTPNKKTITPPPPIKKGWFGWKWLMASIAIILAGVLVWWFWTPISKLFDTSAGYVRTPVGAVAKATNGGLNRITIIGDGEKSPVTIEKSSSGDGQQAAVQFGGGGSNTVTIIQAGSYYEAKPSSMTPPPTLIPPSPTNNIPTAKIWPRDFTPDNTEIVVVGDRHCKLSRTIPPGKDYEFAFPVGWRALMFTSFPDSQYDKTGGNVNMNGTCGQVVNGSSLRYRNNGSSDMLVTFVCDQQVRPHRGLIRRIFGCQ